MPQDEGYADENEEVLNDDFSEFDPTSLVDIQQLSSAIGYSRKVLERFRDNRIALFKEYVGSHYSENGSGHTVPINFLELSTNIYMQRLSAQAPQAEITSDFVQLKEIAGRFEMGANHLVKEIDLGDSISRSVSDALFSMGIAKVGLNATQHEIGGVLHDAGQPFCTSISLDDWVHDMTADKIENGQYEGDYYFITMDEARKLFPKHKDKLHAYDTQANHDRRDHDVSESQTSGASSESREDFRQLVRLLDVWLPKQNLVLTCTVSSDSANDYYDPID
ncbi:hypothetical protein KAR91_86815, partial [Candidatus Pacearchaeota archaeon]|nr:hypothetical protein [Candidatus Pacearchaeota archaeon]